MNGILLNVLFVTLTGCTILAIRKIWGAKLYPQALKGFPTKKKQAARPASSMV